MKRKVYLDVLTIISVFFVVVVHISAINFSKVGVRTTTWLACNIYDSIAHFAAPVLFMVSGAKFLNPDKQISIDRLFKRNVFRIVCAFCFWSAAYSFANNFLVYKYVSIDFIRSFFADFVRGHYHMWFCFAIIFCYIMTPVLRQILKDERIGRYFLVVSIIVVFGLNTIKLIAPLNALVDSILVEGGISIGGYTIYFLIGYFLYRKDIKLSGGGIIAIGVVAVMFTIIATTIVSWGNDCSSERFYSYMLPNTLVWSCVVFLLVKKLCVNKRNTRMEIIPRLSRKLTDASFGAYLVHVFVYNVFLRIGFSPAICSSFVSIPLLAFATWITSIVLSMLIHKIPVVGRYIT